MINKLIFQDTFVAKFIEYSFPVFIIGIISRTFPILSFLYYLVPVLLLFYTILGLIIISRSHFSLRNISIIFMFPVYCLITSLWSLNTFITIQRSLYLLLMYSVILSAIFIHIKYSDKKNLKFLIPANITIVIISLVSLIFKIPENGWTGGNGLGFMGFAGHQNTLAAALLFTLPGIISFVIEQSSKSNKYSKSRADTSSNISRLISRVWLLSSSFLLLTFNILLLFLTYSRTSILALFVGSIIFLILIKSKKILSFLLSITAILLVLYFTIPFIQNSINGILNKDGGRIFGRRIILWEPFFQAAKLGGIIGLGYGISAPEIKTPELTGSHYEDGRYIREKGNSVLAVVEETGIIGLILFLLPIFFIVIKNFTVHNPQPPITYLLLLTVLAAMLLHSQFEAWWVGAGSVTLPLYLIVLFVALLMLRIKN